MIVLVCTVALSLWTAARITEAMGKAGPAEHRSTTWLRGGLLALGLVVIWQALLGLLGQLTPRNTLLLAAATAGLAAWTTRGLGPMEGKAASPSPSQPWGRLDTALVVAALTALALRLGSGLHKATFLYDTLSFHLHFPATWQETGRLGIVPAVFGDPAPAYNPSNAELVFHLLMAPVRSDHLAQCGQLPFAALAMLAVHATVRELGGTRAAGLAAALVFLFVPEVWQQAATAMVDLALAACLLATLPFLVRLGRSRAFSDVTSLGVALGLFLGTKFLALVYMAPLAVWTAVVLLRRPRASWQAVALLAITIIGCGGFWYLRNLAVAGNPIYPVTLQLGPFTLADGLYDGAVMRAWDYHVPVGKLPALTEMIAQGGGGLGLLLASAVALVALRRTVWPPLALGLLGLFWLVVPYQHSRFLFPFFGVLAIAVGAAGGALGRPRVAAGLLTAALAGSVIQFPTWDRWLPWAGALAAAAVHPLLVSRPLGGRSRATVAVVGATALIATLAWDLGRYRARYPGYAVGDELDPAWAWIYSNVHGAHVAYTGVNLAFPLHGRDLANRVSYVNVAGTPHDQLHHFHRRQPAGERSRRPVSAEPAPYRDHQSFEVWWENLRAMAIDVVFVSALYPIVARNVDHDQDGFPTERAWADGHPEKFRLRYATAGVRIYGVERP
jgi:hypothetical protein